ncbi:MAG TPA: hypothetical protein V6C72_07765, partial [Chroococcales cyanobacterium]
MRRIALIVIMAAIAVLSTATLAHAEYKCSEVPATVSSLEIFEEGSCVIGHPVTASGAISIHATGRIETQELNSLGGSGITISSPANIETANLESKGSILLTSTEQSIRAENIHTEGLVILNGYENVSAGEVFAGKPTEGHDIRIFTNAVGSEPFVIGASSQPSDGVISLNSTTTTGGLNIVTETTNNVFVETLSPGGIILDNASSIDVSSTESRSGSVDLKAPAGNISLEEGELDVDGPTGYGAGEITLIAKKVVNNGFVILSASDNATGSNAVDHYVAIATEELILNETLQLYANGEGVAAHPASVNIRPFKGDEAFASVFPAVKISPTIPVPAQEPVTVSGSGELYAGLVGSYSTVYFDAYPFTYESSGAFQAWAEGTEQHQVVFSYDGTPKGEDSLIFSGGPVTGYANGEEGSG